MKKKKDLKNVRYEGPYERRLEMLLLCQGILLYFKQSKQICHAIHLIRTAYKKSLSVNSPVC